MLCRDDEWIHLVVAPWNQWNAPGRQYCGVGAALVGKMVLEKIKRRQDKDPTIKDFTIAVVPDAVSFYLALDLLPVPGTKNSQFTITDRDASNILQRVYCPHAMGAAE